MTASHRSNPDDLLAADGRLFLFPRRGAPASRLASALTLLVSSAAIALSACGQSTDGPTTPSTSPTTTSTSTPSVDPTTAAILNAYVQAEDVGHAAASIPEINYPGITTWFTGQALVREQALLTLYVQLREAEIGTRQLHPQVISVDGTTATVQDCLYSTVVLVYKASNSPVPGQANGSQPEWDLVTATMTDASGSWQLESSQEAFGSSCRPAS